MHIEKWISMTHTLLTEYVNKNSSSENSIAHVNNTVVVRCRRLYCWIDSVLSTAHHQGCHFYHTYVSAPNNKTTAWWQCDTVITDSCNCTHLHQTFTSQSSVFLLINVVTGRHTIISSKQWSYETWSFRDIMYIWFRFICLSAVFSTSHGIPVTDNRNHAFSFTTLSGHNQTVNAISLVCTLCIALMI